MLRWKLKKSIPFEADETVISYMRQPARAEGVDIVTALAASALCVNTRPWPKAQPVPGRDLEFVARAISLLGDKKATLLARVSGVALTTVIVRGSVLCGYRCTELPVHSGDSHQRCCWMRFIPWLPIIRIPGAKGSVRCR